MQPAARPEGGDHVGGDRPRVKPVAAKFGDLLESAEDKPLGKKMEFLAQEMLRETNTTASKSRDAAILTTVIEMKNEIEKIREQVLNAE